MEIEFLLDTNIIIYHLNGVSEISEFIDNNFKKIAISSITYIEVLSFPFKNQEIENEIRTFLKSFKIIELNELIYEQTIKFRKTKKIKIPDAIIAAIASVENIILITRNTKDFVGFNLKMINPFEK